jgi:hypothetical protein
MSTARPTEWLTIPTEVENRRWRAVFQARHIDGRTASSAARVLVQ